MKPSARDRLQRAFGDLWGRASLPVLGCLICQMGLGFGYLFAPLAGEIIAEFEWTRTMYSAARAPQLVVMAFLGPVVGALTVRLGARRVLLSAIPLLGIVMLGGSRLDSLWQLYLTFVLMGIALSGVGDIVVSQLVSEWVDRGRGLALGIVLTGSNLGGFLLVPLAVGIAERESWREAISTVGVFGLVVMFPLAFFLARERYPERVLPTSDEPGGAASSARHASDSDLDLRRALRTPSFWLLAFALFTFFFYFLGMLEHLVLFLTDEGMTRGEAANHFRNAIGLGMVAKIALGAVADHIPTRSAILLDYGLLALSSLVLLGLPDPRLMGLFVLSYGFATAARDVVYPLIISECFGVRYLAEIYGGLLFALLPGGVLGPLFAANVHDRFGSYDVAFATFAGLNLVAVAAVFFVRNERTRQAI